MNVLKALAKMTKVAVRLETENVDLRRDVEVSQKRELMIGDQVAVQREKIQSLEAKLYAAEAKASAPVEQMEKAFGILGELGYVWEPGLRVWLAAPVAPTPELPLPMFHAAVDKLNALGHAWSVPDQRWFDPVPPPPTAAPYLPANWPAHAWATHYLHNPALVAPAYVHAELVGGTYYGDPEDNKHGRICYHVGLKSEDWKVLETRPGYAGPLTRSAAAPILVAHGPETDAPWPNKPRGLGWRNNSMVAAPRDMSDRIEALLLNGTRTSKPASEFEWDTGLSTGVAWWRFSKPDDVEPAQ